MAIARISNGTVVEVRHDLTMNDVPTHKREHWRPVTGTPPVYTPALEQLARPTWSLTTDAAEQVWSIERRPLNEQKAAVKAEAQRRICTLFGTSDLLVALVKQSNAHMRAGHLTDKRINGDVLTQEEAAEADRLRVLRSTIDALRRRSDEIEAMDPIPTDFTSDARWPV